MPVTGDTQASNKPLLLDLESAHWPADEARPYRRRQLLSAVFETGVATLDDATTLPKAWRQELVQTFALSPFQAVERVPSWDGSVRYLLTLHDGRQTEAVYMPYDNRKTVCISSMVGCPAGCRFCATGALGFGRNLSRGEIVAQLLVIAQHEGLAPKDLRNVVLMGMGEALLNYEEAVAAIRQMINPEALDMSPRRITLSTVGLPNRIRRLANEGLNLTLAVSLHAPDEETRKTIIPTAHAHSIDDIMDSLALWQERTNRRVTFEYTMLKGVNDHDWQATKLAARLRGLRAHVNLIPFNDWANSGYESSSRTRIDAFKRRIEANGVSVSVRFSRGQDAGGACGQLSLQAPKEALEAR